MTLPLPLAAACHLPLWFGCVAMVWWTVSIQAHVARSRPGTIPVPVPLLRITGGSMKDEGCGWESKYQMSLAPAQSESACIASGKVQLQKNPFHWKNKIVFFQISHIVGCFTVWAEGGGGGLGGGG